MEHHQAKKYKHTPTSAIKEEKDYHYSVLLDELTELNKSLAQFHDKLNQATNQGQSILRLGQISSSLLMAAQVTLPTPPIADIPDDEN